MKTGKYIRFSVLILPFLFLWIGLNFNLAKFGNDPNYVYLVNALAICDGKDVGYIDHPGTTVIQIGAATIAVQHLISNPENEPLVQYVLKDSHAFVVGIRNVLLFLNAIGLFLLGWLAVKKTGSVWVALLLQAFAFITTNTLDHAWTKISPEPFLFFLTSIYVIVILSFYTEKNINSWKYVIIFALLSGAGLATKATFLPVAVFPFVVLPTLKKKFIYLAGIIPSFVLFTIPIVPEYKNMYFWFRNLSSHSGIYGHGEKGFIDFNTYFPNIFKIIENNFIFAAVLFAGVIILIPVLFQFLKNKKPLNREALFLTALVLSSGLGILMVAKHYHANHYLIPVLQLTGISLFFVVKMILNTNLPQTVKKYTWPAITIVLILFLAWKQPPIIQYINEGYRMTNEEMDATNAMLEQEYPDYTRVYYYPNSLNPYSALNFGDVYCKRQFLPQIKALYPNVFFYHSFEKRIKNWNAEIKPAELMERFGNRIILTGGPRNEQEAAEISRNGFPLKNIYKGRIQAIYLLDTLRFNQFAENDAANIDEIFVCDMEHVSADSRHILGINGEPAGNAGLRTQEKSRSGNYSVKLDESVEFAMEYLLTNPKSGADYEVEVWRNAQNNSGRLVVSSPDSRKFYRAQTDYAITDENGWQLLRINFTATPEMEGEILKIYLWNKDKKVGYFDDLIVRKRSNSIL
jgi:hypothetical protein